MSSEETKLKFKQFLGKFTNFFQYKYNTESAAVLKAEINNTFTREDIIDCWTLIFKAQGPIEKSSDNKYEIYDVSNFMGESIGSSDDYIHTVELTDNESLESIFMKFYFVFYCLVNGVKSNEYKISKTRNGST